MTIQLKNNAFGYLDTAINASDVGLSLGAGEGANFPALSAGQYFYATLSSGSDREVVKVTAIAGDALSITRAQESTTALAFPAGARIELRVTAQTVIDAINDVALADMTDSTFKGRKLNAGTGDPQDLTSDEARKALRLDVDTQVSSVRLAETSGLGDRRAFPAATFIETLHFSPGTAPGLYDATETTLTVNSTVVEEYIEMAQETGANRIIPTTPDGSGLWWLKMDTYPGITPTSGAAAGTWWYDTYADTGVYPGVGDYEFFTVAADKCDALGMGVLYPTSRNQDTFLLNDYADMVYGRRSPDGVPVTLTLAAVSGTSILVTPSFGVFVQDYATDSWEIHEVGGPGRATITTLNTLDDPDTVTVNITVGFSTTSLSSTQWKIVKPDPSTYGLTIDQRVNRAVDQTRMLAARYYTLYGTRSSFRGFYISHEPDHMRAAEDFMSKVNTAAQTGNYPYQNPPLTSYYQANGDPVEIWIGPASPIDMVDASGTADMTEAAITEIGQAIHNSAYTHIAAQDSVGPGINLFTGAQDFVAGQSTTLSQLPAHYELFRKCVDAANRWADDTLQFTKLISLTENWQMDGPSYAYAYPAAGSRTLTQLRADGGTVDGRVWYAVNYMWKPGMTAYPKQAPTSYTISDWRDRASALYTATLQNYKNAYAKAAFQTPRSTLQARLLKSDALTNLLAGTSSQSVSSVYPLASGSLLRIRVYLDYSQITSGSADTAPYFTVQLKSGSTELTTVKTIHGATGRVGGTLILPCEFTATGDEVPLTLHFDNQLGSSAAILCTATVEFEEIV